jgi:cell division protein FtsN
MNRFIGQGRRMKHQSGGTFLGMVIGLVIGLGIALAVAVYVTKVPVPFVNKGQSRSVEQDAAEARKNKDWDPNAPLYGKNPARPAAPMAATSAASESAAPSKAIATSAAGDSRPDARTESKPAVSGDPLGDLARVRSSAATADPFSYFVQVGAFRTTDDAEAQRAKLSLAGVEARVSEREQAGRTVYRVRVGPLEKREDADKTKDKLEALGMEAVLVRVQR